jgi:hypothetical protein
MFTPAAWIKKVECPSQVVWIDPHGGLVIRAMSGVIISGVNFGTSFAGIMIFSFGPPPKRHFKKSLNRPDDEAQGLTNPLSV